MSHQQPDNKDAIEHVFQAWDAALGAKDLDGRWRSTTPTSR